MKFTPELYYLTLVALATLLMWIPYTVARILTRGLLPALGYPDPSYKPDPAWAERARKAHANAIENLAVFAPVVLISAFIGASTSATIFAAKLYLIARIAHYCVYAAGVPVVRTLSFVTGVAAAIIFVVNILSHGF